MRADSLDDVFASLERPPVSLTPDELSYLGCVLILRRVDGARQRVTAAHYVRPFVRDTHGHTQRLGPAVLSTWDPARDAFEDFGWGITPELAFRIGVRPGDFELEVDRRRAVLAGPGRVRRDRPWTRSTRRSAARRAERGGLVGGLCSGAVGAESADESM